MNIQTTQSHKKKKGKKGRKGTPEQRFQREWQRVLNAQKKNERLRANFSVVVEEVSELIREDEERFATVTYLQAEQLIQFLTRKSLSQWQRNELSFWIVENIHCLTYYLFTDHLNLNDLKASFKMAMQASVNDESLSDFAGTEKHSAESNSRTKKSAAGTDFDMFQDFCDTDDTSDEEILFNEDDFSQQFYDDIYNEDAQHEQQHKRELQALDYVLKSSSLTKMFRKIVSRLHPDREQDPDKKIKKNKQMSELIEARDTRDVLTLFTLYERHIGEPMNQLLGDDDHERLVTLLKHQVTQLKHEGELFIGETSMAGMIYRLFNAPSKAKIQAKVRKHIQQLHEDIDVIQHFLTDASSLQKLKPYLESRNPLHAEFSLADMKEAIVCRE
jgi:hypothetical protein